MSAHPLDPLSADEIRQAAAVLRRDKAVDEAWRFASIELKEPAKDVVRQFDPAAPPPPREARVVCWSRVEQVTYKALVSLSDDTVLSWADVPGEQPNMTIDEWHEAGHSCLSDPEVVVALAKRGITDLANVLIDTWTYAHSMIPEEYPGRRLGWTDTWLRGSENGNPYAHPVNGLHVILDMNTMEVLRIEDSFSIEPPEVMGEYVPSLVPGMKQRTDIKPLEVHQPEGSSLTVEGNEVRWQKWSMRVGFNYREGLVIHQVAYSDDGVERPVAHRLSFAEMIVPYRDPSPDHYRRTAFDIGEWGLGFMTQSLELGCDCLGEITYLDAVLHDSRGEPLDIPNAICVHEEDDAVLWKHVDERAGAEVRRSRRLVVSFHATVANYEYLVYWRFYQDGTIECEVRATGIMVTTAVASAEDFPATGAVVDNRTYAPYHQHFIVARLDMEVDGPDNTVLECHTEPLPISPDNPYGLALVEKRSPLRTESEGAQDYDWASQRSWTVVNRGRTNSLGGHPGYKLVPGGIFPAMFPADSPMLTRAGVIEHTLWVTAYDEEQRWPAGEFCIQSSGDQGLPDWIEADRPIEDADVVLWYVFGLHHITRPEDWPVMPADIVSFQLKPVGFFDRNPALDLPPSPGHS